MPKALISVTNKSGVVELAQSLTANQYEILTTGGTGRLLRENDIAITEIAEFTSSPEMLDGRVKTLHPRIFGGILGRPNVDEAEFQTHGLEPISVVAVNLYEFENTIAKTETSHSDAIEAIDIGGVSLIRAAAKNHEHVLVVVDPADYQEVADRIAENRLDGTFRAQMAAKAFQHTAAYDAAIARYLSAEEKFPSRIVVSLERDAVLRYGENPHQHAALYRASHTQSDFTQVQGKALSYNNIVDTYAALQCLHGLESAACAIVKHANPCGLATAPTLYEAYERAFRADPTSAFGGIIAFNQTLDGSTLARILDNQFAEVVVAPAVDDKAPSVAKRRKALRLLTHSGQIEDVQPMSVTTIGNGALVQDFDSATLLHCDWEVVTERTINDKEAEDLFFAWHVVKHVKSNAIVFVRDGATVGIGAGQPNRVVSVRIAAMRMAEEGLNKAPCVMASDAFFPFRDGIDVAAKAGVTAVIQPGGSIRDDEVIAACNEHDIAMIATGFRHFKH